MAINHLAADGGVTTTADPDPHDWRLFLKTVAAFALLLFLADLFL